MKTIRCCIAPAALLAQMLAWQPARADSALGADSVQGSLPNPGGNDPTLEPDPRGKATMLPQLSRTPAGLTEAWVPAPAPSGQGAGWNARWSGEIGTLGTIASSRAARSGLYSDRRDGPWLHAFGVEGEREDTARYFSLNAGELGRRDQSFRAALGEYGRYRLEASASGIPHPYAYDVHSVFQGAGGSELRLLPGLVPGGSSSAQIAAALQHAGATDLTLERKRLVLSAEATPNAGLGAYLRMTRDRRDGARPFGGSLTFPDLGLPDLVETIEPIRSTTYEFQTGVRWVSDKMQANLGYAGSFFRNDLHALTWQSPFAVAPGYGAAVPMAQFALPPNNNYHNIKLDFGGALPWRGNFNGSLSWGRMTQNDALLAPTIRTGSAPDGTNFEAWNTPAALSQTNAGARIDTFLASGGVSIAPLARLTLRAKLRHYEENNKTSYTAFNPLTGQYGYIGDDGGMAFRPAAGVPASLDPVYVPGAIYSAIHYRSIPFDYKRDNFSLEGDYRLGAKTSLGFAYERENFRRNVRERDRTWEDRLRLTIASRTLEWATWRLSYQYADRSGSEYHPNPYQAFYIGQGQGVQNPPYALAEMRKFDLADRRQHKLDARINFLLRQDMDLVATARAIDNRYGAEYGRTRERNASLNLDWNWSLSPKASFHANYGYQHAGTGMANINDNDTGASGPANAGGAVFPFANAWSADTRDVAHNFGIGARYVFSRWTLESHYHFTQSTTAVGYGYAGIGALTGATPAAAGDAMPDIVFRQHSLETSLLYRADRRFAVRFYHRYDNTRIVDWHDDGMPQLTPTELFLGAGPQSFHAHTIGILLQFRL